MFARPRVFADPFGSFIEGRTQRQKNDIALADFENRDERADLENEALARQNELDELFALDERNQRFDQNEIAIERSIFDLNTDRQFEATERQSILDARSVTRDIAAFELELDREFGRGDRETAADQAAQQLRATTQANDINERFGTAQAQAGIDADRALATQRNRPPRDPNAVSPAAQRLLDSINGVTSQPAQAAPQQSSALAALEQSLSLGATLPDSTVNNLLDIYLSEVQKDPNTVANTQQNFPQLFEILENAQN